MADGKSILLAGLLAAMCSASSWASEPTGAFQGLPWGASEREIESRFPGQLKRNACQDTLAKLQTAGGRVCDNPIIEPYEVFGIPFKLSFGLSKEKRALVDVVLFYAAPPVESTAELTLEQAWSIRYDRLYEALVARYGKAAFKSPRMGDEK